MRLILEEGPKSAVELQRAADGVDPGMKTIAQIVEMADEAESEKIRLDFDPDRRTAIDVYRARQAKENEVGRRIKNGKKMSPFFWSCLI